MITCLFTWLSLSTVSLSVPLIWVFFFFFLAMILTVNVKVDCNIVSAWLRYDSHSRAWWKILVSMLALITLVISKFKLHPLRSRKATTNSKQIHVETNLSSYVSKTQQASEITCTKVSGSVQPPPTWKLTHKWHQYLALLPIPKRKPVAPNLTLRWHTVLELSVATANQLDLWMCPGNFSSTRTSIIKSHHLYPVTGSVLNLRHLFIQICIGNPLEASRDSTSCNLVLLAQSSLVLLAARVFTMLLLSLHLTAKWLWLRKSF